MSFVKKQLCLKKSRARTIPRTEVGTKLFLTSKWCLKQFRPQFFLCASQTSSWVVVGGGAEAGGRSCIKVFCLGNHGGAVEASGGCVGVRHKATPHFSTFAHFARLRMLLTAQHCVARCKTISQCKTISMFPVDTIKVLSRLSKLRNPNSANCNF